MAQEMDDDLEFLLPSELLTDDDILTDVGLSSDLRSPVESVTGTTETCGEEDDFISELTRKLTHSTLSYDYPAKSFKQTGSPQSTLSGMKTGSIGSPSSDSRVFSPPDEKDSLSWDMIYAAAEEAARIRMVEEAAAFYTSKLFDPTRKPDPPTAGFYSGQAQAHARRSYQQLQASKDLQMKQQKMMMNNGGMSLGHGDYLLRTRLRDGGGDRAYGLSVSAWPTLQQSQQRTGAGVKPVYLREPGPIKERVGTGVFMPRRYCSTPTETRKKPVHDSMDAHFQPRAAGNFIPDYDSVSKMGHNQGRNHLRPPPLMKQELALPREWTY